MLVRRLSLHLDDPGVIPTEVSQRGTHSEEECVDLGEIPVREKHAVDSLALESCVAKHRGSSQEHAGPCGIEDTCGKGQERPEARDSLSFEGSGLAVPLFVKSVRQFKRVRIHLSSLGRCAGTTLPDLRCLPKGQS